MRFVLEKCGRGKWTIYDNGRWSYPGHVPGFGRVKAEFTDENEALGVANALEAFCEENPDVWPAKKAIL